MKLNTIEMNKKSYNEAASNYDKSMCSKSSTNYWVEYPYMKSLMGDVKGLDVLDICCGTGRYSLLAAKKEANVTSVDIAEKCIDIAKNKAKINNLKINFNVSEVEKYLTTNTIKFDMITCGMGIEYFENLPKLFKYISNSLKIGGKFIFSIVHPMRLNGEYLRNKDSGYTFNVYDYFNLTFQKRTWKSVTKDNGKPFETAKYAYRFEDIIDALSEYGLLVEKLRESKPSENVKKEDLNLYNRLKCCPTYAIIKAIKIK